MDYDGSETVSLAEFTKACREFKEKICEENLQIWFNKLEANRDGNLN